MKLNRILAAVAAMFGGAKAGRFVGRARTTDVSFGYQAFLYRMPAGFPGDVNRAHPASVEPNVNDPTNPVTAFGVPVVANGSANTVRTMISTDTAVTAVYGFAVRSFPYQQSTTSSAYGGIGFGAGAVPAGQPLDVLRAGYIMSSLNTGTATKGGAVFVWVAATSGVHIQGGLEIASSAGNTASLDPTKYQFNGPADANGVVEVSVNQ